jgi:hypothetical protein
MKYLFIFSFTGLFFFGHADAQLSFNKIDSTLKMGNAGYRVSCRNKNVNANDLTIIPVGFSGDAQRISFVLGGRLGRAEIDDLNGDGFPDLVLYIYSDSTALFGTVYAFLSEANKSISPCVLPDTRMDGKINIGYQGHDQFSLMGSYLQQKFPVYKTGEKDKPTGGTRVVLYQLIRGGDDKFKFNIIRFYDTSPGQ